MVKRLHVCAGCGADWIGWECWQCKCLQSTHVSEAVAHSFQRQYAERVANAKRTDFDPDETNRLLYGKGG